MQFTSTEKYAKGVTIIISGELSEDTVELGNRQVAISSLDVLRIHRDDTLTNQQKIAALRQLIITQAQSWRLAEAQDALTILNDAFPEFTINFDRAPLPEIVEAEPESEPMMAMAFDMPEPIVDEPRSNLFVKAKDKIKSWFA